MATDVSCNICVRNGICDSCTPKCQPNSTDTQVQEAPAGGETTPPSTPEPRKVLNAAQLQLIKYRQSTLRDSSLDPLLAETSEHTMSPVTSSTAGGNLYGRVHAHHNMFNSILPPAALLLQDSISHKGQSQLHVFQRPLILDMRQIGDEPANIRRPNHYKTSKHCAHANNSSCCVFKPVASMIVRQRRTYLLQKKNTKRFEIVRPT